ncbi:MAG TPA: hypothetical protein VIL64_04410 [Solirubrobacteraceae bacterium]|jgi:hypothetical protein
MHGTLIALGFAFGALFWVLTALGILRVAGRVPALVMRGRRDWRAHMDARRDLERIAAMNAPARRAADRAMARQRAAQPRSSRDRLAA